MNDFHTTVIGQRFLNGTMPKIADALTVIAANVIIIADQMEKKSGEPSEIADTEAAIRVIEKLLKDDPEAYGQESLLEILRGHLHELRGGY